MNIAISRAYGVLRVVEERGEKEKDGVLMKIARLPSQA
jgi:hypothetical protein